MILLQPYVIRQFYLLQIPVTDNADTGAKIQLNHAVLAFFSHPGAMTPMGAITPMGALARMITVYWK